MHRFIKLPSGLVVNLTQVSRVIPVDNRLEVYFADGDKVVLEGEDAPTFHSSVGNRRSVVGSLESSIFWIAVIGAIGFGLRRCT